MTLKHYFIIAFSLFINVSIYSQKQNTVTIDSLSQNVFKELRTQFYNTDSDAEASLYADIYLKKAKQRKDSKKIIEGYYYKSLVSVDSLMLKYVDSIIGLSSKRTDHYFMENALVIKAGVYYTARSYRKALKLYVEAQQYAKKSDNKPTLFNIEYNIGITYNLIGDYENGLKTLKKSLRDSEKLELQDQWKRLKIMSSLVASYRQLGMYDSISYYTTKGIKKTHKKPKIPLLV